MTSLTKTVFMTCATRTGAFGVRVIQSNEISDLFFRAAGASEENHACMTVANGSARRGLEQGKH
ncbi:MAG: hypothetical protein VX874_25260 [Pseudomonadota bacterium]|nr:hypothetical protein [Pseudomonadota bacterium]